MGFHEKLRRRYVGFPEKFEFWDPSLCSSILPWLKIDKSEPD